MTCSSAKTSVFKVPKILVRLFFSKLDLLLVGSTEEEIVEKGSVGIDTKGVASSKASNSDSYC